MSQVKSQPRLLIVRLSAIGDIVMASPLIGALRAAYPDAYIAWLAQPECVALLEKNPELDEVIAWPRGDWQRLWRERRFSALASAVRAFRRELRARRIDTAIDVQGLLKSGLLAWLSGAPERVGLGSREGSRWLMTRVVPKGGDPQRIGSEYLYLAEQLGLPAKNFAMQIAVDAEDRRFAADYVASNGMADGYAVVCPFTTRPQKHWFEERWTELAGRIRTELGLSVIVLGGPGDVEAARRITAAAEDGIASAAGQTSLREAAALIEGAALLVGVDTGLSHMGIAFGVPTVALFGSTVPYLDTTRANARVIYHRLACSPCRRNPTCGGAYTCMREIGVEEVTGVARAVMAAPKAVA
jgi:heptosyltransferase-1